MELKETGTAARTRIKALRIYLLGVPLNTFDMNETLDIACQAMAKRERLQHVAINVAKLVNMSKDPTLKRDVEESDLISIDGVGIVWGCRLLGLPVKERVAGIDLMENLLAICEREKFRPFFLGARQDVLEKAIREILNRHPKLEIAGYRNGYFTTEEEKHVVDEIKSVKSDCLFIAMSSPKKENFLHNYRDELDVPFLMGIGGSLDVIAGQVRRAPLWMQKTGLEWLFRLAQEPRRMWRRYVFTNILFASLLGQALIAKSLGLSKQES